MSELQIMDKAREIVQGYKDRQANIQAFKDKAKQTEERMKEIANKPDSLLTFEDVQENVSQDLFLKKTREHIRKAEEDLKKYKQDKGNDILDIYIAELKRRAYTDNSEIKLKKEQVIQKINELADSVNDYLTTCANDYEQMKQEMIDNGSMIFLNFWLLDSLNTHHETVKREPFNRVNVRKIEGLKDNIDAYYR